MLPCAIFSSGACLKKGRAKHRRSLERKARNRGMIGSETVRRGEMICVSLKLHVSNKLEKELNLEYVQSRIVMSISNI